MKLILSWVSCQKKHGRTTYIYIYNTICINILYAHSNLYCTYSGWWFQPSEKYE